MTIYCIILACYFLVCSNLPFRSCSLYRRSATWLLSYASADIMESEGKVWCVQSESHGPDAFEIWRLYKRTIFERW